LPFSPERALPAVTNTVTATTARIAEYFLNNSKRTRERLFLTNASIFCSPRRKLSLIFSHREGLFRKADFPSLFFSM
ncbi:MAG TPA: hypothetical protein GX706_01845, partial [Candidatus Moranbacteria bacterium]|nr:hypothetical protein [Candidatus Moranbacteria bacterium]